MPTPLKLELNFTGEEMVDFILKYRRGWAFKGWKLEDIQREIIRVCTTGEIILAINKHSLKITGLLTYRVLPENKIWVSEILTSNLEAFPLLCMSLIEQFPGYTFIGNRKGKIKTYDGQQFLRILRSIYG